MIDFIALKLRLETFETDAVDVYYEEEVVVEPAPEYLEARGKDTNVVWRLRRQLLGRRSAGQGWMEHLAGILVDKLGFERCKSAPQF